MHLAILLLLGINRKVATGKLTVSTPLSLPVLLLLLDLLRISVKVASDSGLKVATDRRVATREIKLSKVA